MGLCHEFGSQIRAGCDHPMRAGASACSCAECGVVCRGLFDGCPDVWARGPRPVAISATRAGSTNGAPAALAAVPRPRPDEPPRAVAAAAIGPAPDDRSGPGPGAGPRPAAGGEHRDERPSDAGREGAGDPRREVFRWFEEAFEGVRNELQALIGSMTHQQAMLAELLDSRQAELRLALVAESLPDVVADAVRAAMDGHAPAGAGAADRDEIEQLRATTDATVESLQASLRRLTDTIAVHDEETEQRESVRLGTLKGSITRQIGPIGDALAELGAKVDALAARLDDATAVPPPAPAPPAPAARLTPARAPRPAPALPVPPEPLPPVPARAGTPRTARRGAAAAVEPPRPAPEAPAARPAASVAPKATPRSIHRTDTAVTDATASVRRVSTRKAPVAAVAPVAAPDPSPDTVNGTGAASSRRRGRATGAAARGGGADPIPDEPVDIYELETDDDWAPPDWVSDMAPEVGDPPPPPRPAARATLTKSGAAKLAAKARAARPTRTSG